MMPMKALVRTWFSRIVKIEDIDTEALVSSNDEGTQDLPSDFRARDLSTDQIDAENEKMEREEEAEEVKRRELALAKYAVLIAKKRKRQQS